MRKKAYVLSHSASSLSLKRWLVVNRDCHRSLLQNFGIVYLWEVLPNYLVSMNSSSIGTPLGCRAPQGSVCKRGRMRRDVSVRWRLQRPLLSVPLMNRVGKDVGSEPWSLPQLPWVRWQENKWALVYLSTLIVLNSQVVCYSTDWLFSFVKFPLFHLSPF